MQDYDVDDVVLPLQPPLDYTAPELTRKGAGGPFASTDIFSLALLAFHLLSRHSLLKCNNNLQTVWWSTLTFQCVGPYEHF